MNLPARYLRVVNLRSDGLPKVERECLDRLLRTGGEAFSSVHGITMTEASDD